MGGSRAWPKEWDGSLGSLGPTPAPVLSLSWSPLRWPGPLPSPAGGHLFGSRHCYPRPSVLRFFRQLQSHPQLPAVELLPLLCQVSTPPLMLDHMVTLFFCLLRKLHTVLHSDCIVYIPTNSVPGFCFLHILTNMCYCLPF